MTKENKRIILLILLALIVLAFMIVLNSFLVYRIKNNNAKILNHVIKQKKSTKEFELNISETYLAVGGIDLLKPSESNLSFSSQDESVATVDSDGLIKGIGKGTTKIEVSNGTISKYVDVTVTNLIIPRPSEFDTSKPYLTCSIYSKEDNDLLDEIYNYRMERVGINTRASVVEALRFITLELPYRIPYFSENGRMGSYGGVKLVDGEGRYYHKGLYLSQDRTKNITNPMNGPAPWGCPIYSVPSGGMRANGFDCSGFISYIVYNGGFDPEDIGAGISSYKDMTDLGEKKVLSEAIANDSLKVGDLLSGQGIEGGHIAMLVGIKDGYYYIGESLWHPKPNNGALISKFNSQEILNHYYWQIDMDEYYKEDGDLTNYW